MTPADRAHFRARLAFFGFLLLASFLLGVAKAHFGAIVAFYRAEPVLFGLMVCGLVLVAVAIWVWLADEIRRADVSDPHRYCAEDDHGGKLPMEGKR